MKDSDLLRFKFNASGVPNVETSKTHTLFRCSLPQRLNMNLILRQRSNPETPASPFGNDTFETVLVPSSA